MASTNNSPLRGDSRSVLSRHLAQEEVQWVRDLPNHPGWLLYQAALQELLVQAFQELRREKDAIKLYTLQGRSDGLESALGLPAILTEPRPTRGE